MGGGQDVIVPPAFVRRVAAEIERPAVILPDLGHSLMLEDDWRDPADRILAWLQQFRRERSPAEVT
jgi:pimeloyl-ACP methyl ester carboxylesterase